MILSALESPCTADKLCTSILLSKLRDSKIFELELRSGLELWIRKFGSEVEESVVVEMNCLSSGIDESSSRSVSAVNQ